MPSPAIKQLPINTPIRRPISTFLSPLHLNALLLSRSASKKLLLLYIDYFIFAYLECLTRRPVIIFKKRVGFKSADTRPLIENKARG